MQRLEHPAGAARLDNLRWVVPNELTRRPDEAIDLRLQHSWVSFRYTTESNDHVLPSYGIASASARIAIPLGASILNVIGEIDNIFGEAYEVIPQYPMPVRAFSVSLGVDL